MVIIAEDALEKKRKAAVKEGAEVVPVQTVILQAPVNFTMQPNPWLASTPLSAMPLTYGRTGTPLQLRKPGGCSLEYEMETPAASSE
jgi:hypothetical protein